MSFIYFAFNCVEWSARPAAKMWAKSISSFKYMQIRVDLLASQEATFLDSYVLSEMRDKSSIDRPLLPGYTTSGGITPIRSRRVSWKKCTRIDSLNGCSRSRLALQVPIAFSAWGGFREGAQSGLGCRA